MIGIVDLNMSNIGSVQRALSHVGASSFLCHAPSDIEKATSIVLPGVGSFFVASERLIKSGLKESIRQAVLVEEKPILGICLGMQLLAKEGFEGEPALGLGLIDASVVPLSTKLRVPHVGWNSVSSSKGGLMHDIPPESCFYFVHSYHFSAHEKIDFETCDYGQRIISYVQKGNIHGTQFHPEKSQKFGLQLLKNFTELEESHAPS